MRNKKNVRNWFRFAMKMGLLATDVAVWKAVSDMLHERSDRMPSVRRSHDLAQSLSAPRHKSHTATLLTGIGIGVGVGMLLAPVSGERARGAIRDKATDIKNKVTDVADWASRMGGQTRGQTTGTYAH